MHKNHVEFGLNSEKRKWIYAAIKDAYGTIPYIIDLITKFFVTEGLEVVLGYKEQLNCHRKVDGLVEDHIITITYSEVLE